MRHPNRLTKAEEGYSRPGISQRKQKDIVDAEINEPHLPSTKRKKKGKKPWRWAASICPFCDGTLASVSTGKWYWSKKYAITCPCGASVHEDCPCCHRETWAKNDWKGTLMYKHKAMGWGGCGFVGERIEKGGVK